MDAALSSLNETGAKFCNSKTGSMAGIVDDREVLIVFDQSKPADGWSDPRLGLLLMVRPVTRVVRSHRPVRGAAYAGYYASRSGPGSVLRHYIVLYDEKRNIIQRLDNIVGLRKEQ